MKLRILATFCLAGYLAVSTSFQAQAENIGTTDNAMRIAGNGIRWDYVLLFDITNGRNARALAEIERFAQNNRDDDISVIGVIDECVVMSIQSFGNDEHARLRSEYAFATDHAELTKVYHYDRWFANNGVGWDVTYEFPISKICDSAYKQKIKARRDEYERASIQRKMDRPCQAPGSPSQSVDLHREVKIDVEGDRSEYWYCVNVTPEERNLEVHMYTGPALTPGFTGRGNGRLEIDLFLNGEWVNYATGGSGRGGHHYTSGLLYRDLEVGRYHVRITNRLLKKGRVALYVARDTDDELDYRTPVEQKYRDMD